MGSEDDIPHDQRAQILKLNLPCQNNLSLVFAKLEHWPQSIEFAKNCVFFCSTLLNRPASHPLIEALLEINVTRNTLIQWYQKAMFSIARGQYSLDKWDECIGTCNDWMSFWGTEELATKYHGEITNNNETTKHKREREDARQGGKDEDDEKASSIKGVDDILRDAIVKDCNKFKKWKAKAANKKKAHRQKESKLYKDSFSRGFSLDEKDGKEEGDDDFPSVPSLSSSSSIYLGGGGGNSPKLMRQGSMNPAELKKKRKSKENEESGNNNSNGKEGEDDEEEFRKFRLEKKSASSFFSSTTFRLLMGLITVGALSFSVFFRQIMGNFKK